MEIAYSIICYVLTCFITFFQIAIFITQFYNCKRMFIIEKQRILGINNNLFLLVSFFLFCISFGLIFEHELVANTLVLIALLFNLLSFEKVKIKFTRRSITLLMISLLLPCFIFLNPTYLIFICSSLLILLPSSLVLISHFIDYPFELLIRSYYIKKAKNKLKMNDNLKIIAITGSYGKTSFKNFLFTILNGKLNVLKTPGSVNTPMGICKFINSELTPYDDYLILELGVDAPHTMKKFFRIFKPNVGIITSIGPMHLATFKTIENIAKEKMILFNNLVMEAQGFYNADSIIKIKNNNNIKHLEGYSLSEINILNIDQSGATFEYANRVCKVNLLSKYQLTNLVGSMKVAKFLGLEDDFIIKRLGNIVPEKHRMSIEKKGSTTIVDDSYNNNPLELADTIELFSSFKGRKGIIINGVIEVGANSENVNFKIGEKLGDFDDVVVLSLSSEGIKRGLESIKKEYKIFGEYSEGYEYLKKRDLDYILLCSYPHDEYIK